VVFAASLLRVVPGTHPDRVLIIEIFSGTPDDRPQPEETQSWRPAPALNQRGRD
jgi:hypothetical protein